MVRVYILQKRKFRVEDKAAESHRNKRTRTISKIFENSYYFFSFFNYCYYSL